MRRQLRSLAGIALTGVVLGVEAVAAASLPERVVVVVTVDTLRADRLGYAGHSAARTPHLDALARRGTHFAEATTPLPRTTPALASLFTGWLPERHGSMEVGQPFDAGVTVAELLAPRPWWTAAANANPAAGRSVGLAAGFRAFRMLPRAPAGAVTAAALDLVDRAPEGWPIFLWAHYHDPHWPYRVDGPDDPTPCGQLFEWEVSGQLTRGQIYSNGFGLAHRALPDCSQAYDEAVAAADAGVGALFAGLERRGLLAHARIVFTSDHGENLGEEGLYYEHGPSLHDASVRVPLVVAGPGIAAGRVDRRVARLEDLAPTLLDLAGISAGLGEPDGVSLMGRLAPGPVPPALGSPVARIVSGSALQPEVISLVVSGRAAGRHCVSDRQHSLCRSPNRGSPALFDHVADPGLFFELGEGFDEVRRRLGRSARRWPPETARARAIRRPALKLLETPEPSGARRREWFVAGSPQRPERLNPEARALEAQLDQWALPATAASPPRRPGEVDLLRALGYLAD